MTTPRPIKGAEKLPSKWSFTEDLGGHDIPIRLEGEIENVMVRGTIPDSINGTFYRVAQDQVTPVPEAFSPLGGHGCVSAFRIHRGKVDFKVRYVQNDRYKLERNLGKSIWADLLNEPLGQHPCIRAVLATSSNTNIIYWAGRLLALSEPFPATSMDPDTLETTGTDPFGNQIVTPTFSAHPHVDPHVEELVAFSLNFPKMEITSYSIDRQGIVKNEHLIKQALPGTVHDIAITDNWIVFCQWPVGPNENRKPGESHVVWDTERDATFIVTPRRPASPLAGSGWKPYEQRSYTYPVNSEIVHTAGAWEVGGKIFFDGTLPHHAIFPFWNRQDRAPHSSTETLIDLVTIEIDPRQPTGTQIVAPVVLVDIPNEFCRIDERFHCRQYDHIFMNVFHSETKQPLNKPIYQGLNATAMLTKSTGKLQIYYPGPQCRCQEPLFIPRSDDAPEGDGYVIFAVDRLDINLTNVVILDTKDFETPVAVLELPMRMRAQIHGNWVDAKELSGKLLVAPPSLHHMTWNLPQQNLPQQYSEGLVAKL